MKKPAIGAWRNADAERRFRETEDELFGETGLPTPEAIDVETSFGTTRVYRWRGDGEPIVFLHGMGGTGLTWGAYVEKLVGRDVYAVDTIGDVGRSVHRVAFEDVTGLARWLDETLVGVGIEHAHLGGTSYGAFLALNLAARKPDRVASLTLIDSAGLARFRLLRFMLWGLPMLLGSKAPGPIRRFLARKRPMLEDPRVMRLALLGQTNHVYALPTPEPLSDDELRSITAPAVVIVADKSAPFPPKVAAERARLIPGAEVVVVPKAGHEISWTHVDECLSRMAHVTDATL